MKPSRKWAAGLALLLLLGAAFWYGGGAPGLQGWGDQGAQASGESGGVSAPAQPGPVPKPEGGADAPDRPDAPPPAASPVDGAAPEEAPSPDTTPGPGRGDVPPQDDPAQAGQSQTSEAGTDAEEEGDWCTFSIRCSAILDNLDWLDPDKRELVPDDGVLLAPAQVELEEGDTPFSLLQRLTREQGVHMEASYTPGVGSAYVEGIANLYEFDCGQRSGWLYLVNGEAPGVSCSEYALAGGDTVEWVYTCRMGEDVGTGVSG